MKGKQEQAMDPFHMETTDILKLAVGSRAVANVPSKILINAGLPTPITAQESSQVCGVSLH